MLRVVTSPETIQDDHRELMSLVESLRRRLDGPAWTDPMVGSLLESLVAHLEAHFQNEEVDGFFDEVLDLAPQATPRVDALLAEHQRMLTVADDLCHRYHRVRRTPVSWRHLGDSFQRLRQMLLVHECDERHLLQEVFIQDEGSKD
ncbi:MAG: hemerythrin domain-containing protein [Planctomycetota bacterium]